MTSVARLNVLIKNDDGSWFAQGLEIDYAVEAKSLDHLKTRFEQGLASTVEAHRRAFGQLANLTQPAPDEFWRLMKQKVNLLERFADSSGNAFPRATTRVPEALPFGRFSYYEVMSPSALIGDNRKDDSGGPPQFCHTVLNLLRERGVSVSIEDNESDPAHVSWGVQATISKGSILEVQCLPGEVHRNLLKQISRKFGVELNLFYDSYNASFDRALAELEDEGETDDG